MTRAELSFDTCCLGLHKMWNFVFMMMEFSKDNILSLHNPLVVKRWTNIINLCKALETASETSSPYKVNHYSVEKNTPHFGELTSPKTFSKSCQCWLWFQKIIESCVLLYKSSYSFLLVMEWSLIQSLLCSHLKQVISSTDIQPGKNILAPWLVPRQGP